MKERKTITLILFLLYLCLSIKMNSITWSILWGDGEEKNKGGGGGGKEGKKPQGWVVRRWVLDPCDQKWGHNDWAVQWDFALLLHFTICYLKKKTSNFPRLLAVDTSEIFLLFVLLKCLCVLPCTFFHSRFLSSFPSLHLELFGPLPI